MTYDSAGAQVLRAVTSKLEPCWTPEDGWVDPAPCSRCGHRFTSEDCNCPLDGCGCRDL